MGYVLGVMFFLGTIIYFIIKLFVSATRVAVHLAKSSVYKKFSFDRINLDEEYPVIAYVQSAYGLDETLREISDVLNRYAFFRYDNLTTYDAYTKEYIATDYLMSKKGFVSRYMAEEGCYRVPEGAPQIVLDAMEAYVKLIQDNIRNKSGTTILSKEIHWKNNERNYVWVESPADPEYWRQGKYLTSGYKCTYRTKPMI